MHTHKINSRKNKFGDKNDESSSGPRFMKQVWIKYHLLFVGSSKWSLPMGSWLSDLILEERSRVDIQVTPEDLSVKCVEWPKRNKHSIFGNIQKKIPQSRMMDNTIQKEREELREWYGNKWKHIQTEKK